MKDCDSPVRCDGRKAPFVRPRWCRERLMMDFGSESSVQQGFGEQTNINEIVKRFQRTGFMPPQRQPVYADVVDLQGDLTELIERSRQVIATAESSPVLGLPLSQRFFLLLLRMVLFPP